MNSFLWLQVIVLVTALYLKIKNPERIDNMSTLDQSVKLVIASILIPTISRIFTFSGSNGFGIFFMSIEFFLNIGIAILVAISIYKLWSSIKYQVQE